MRIALATCEAPQVPDTDIAPLVDALDELGAETAVEVWSDRAVDWSSYDVVQLSSTWDYHRRLDEFREWLERIEGLTRIENPRDLVEWNIDKRYLLELEDSGVPTVPTVWAVPEEAAAAQADAGRSGWERVVVKPAVDLGANRLRLVAAGEVAEAVEEVGDPCLVQPYLPSLESAGELSLVYFRGELSHAILKTAAEGDFRIQEHYGGRYREVNAPASAAETGERVMSLLAADEIGPPGMPGAAPLYGRVDLVAGPDGELCVIEVELIEPSFFFDVAGGEAAARLARQLVA